MSKGQKGLAPSLNNRYFTKPKAFGCCSAGLTLVEALVALAVLSFGLIPALAVVSSSVKISSLIKNNLIAANLAQEGAEVIRGLRDASWFAGQPFDFNLPGGQWRVEWNTNGTTLPLQTIGSNPPLKFHPSTGLYDYSTGIDGIDTNFKRGITIVKVPNTCNCELIVQSRVQWQEHGGAKAIQVESHLYDWK